jgi:hypothetical protein
MATCHVCPPDAEKVADEEMVNHLRLLHPELYGDGPERWPDGSVVVYDQTLEPGDFDA